MLEMVGASFILITLMMTILWIVYFFQRNATIVDFGWVVSFILAAWVYMLLGDGDLIKRLIITFMVTVWAGRLLSHLWHRYNPSVEDPRYIALRERLGLENSDFKFFLMFVFQGFIALILTLPFLIVCVNGSSDWNFWEGWGFLVWLIGVAGESLADRQLSLFKKQPANRGKVCEMGLWHWSRHPNYFFEFVIWLGFALFAFGSTFGIFAFSAPIIMYYLLVHVSGVPLAEAQALQDKGEAYKQYQKSTSAFFPWFRS